MRSVGVRWSKAEVDVHRCHRCALNGLVHSIIGQVSYVHSARRDQNQQAWMREKGRIPRVRARVRAATRCIRFELANAQNDVCSGTAASTNGCD